MRLHVHDFSGHPFQAQLSRTLARSHRVRHSWCDQYVSGKGALAGEPGDPATLRMEPVAGRVRFDKYHPLRRAVFEVAYARDLWRALVADGAPDAVVLCNAPLITTYLVHLALRRRRVPWVFWHQDIYSMGMADEVARRFPGPLAGRLARLFDGMERACVRDADAVVAIDEVFRDRYRTWGLDVGHVSVIPNWAPLDEIRLVERDNGWAREQGLPADRFRIVYSGTLGRKHNPLLLLDLLARARESGVDAHLVVVSQGDGVEQLRAAAGDDERVSVLPFQPAERLAEVLSCADVLVALLEPEASMFSIPSKVLSYLAAGRPIAGLMPEDNAAAHAIRAVGSATARPDDRGLGEIAAWVAGLAADPARRERLGDSARGYAEREFDVDDIAGRFRGVLEALPGPVATRR